MQIGIDLGTTNSLVAQLGKDGPRIIRNELGDDLTPSAVALAPDGSILVGRSARDQLVLTPDAGMAFFKRDMGTPATYTFGNREWSPTECSATILRELRRIAEADCGETITEAVITVPAYFHNSQRQATVDAANIAGLKVTRIINEPTAAALAFGYQNPDRESLLLVFDLGGGTFDVTLLEVFDGVVEIKSSAGESRLGGEDYTDALCSVLILEHQLEIPDQERFVFRQKVEVAKRQLATFEAATVMWAGKEIQLTREDLAAASETFSGQIRQVVRRCLRDARVTPDQLEDILLVGGASRMPVISQFIQTELGRAPNKGVDPDRVVAMGAAIQSALCHRNEAVQDLVLTDVSSHTLGIETARQSAIDVRGGWFTPLIDRNTTLPASRVQRFSTMHPSQDEVEVKVYQGEARMVTDNRLIGSLTVRGLIARPGQKHPGEFDVRFTYDMNGILQVEIINLQQESTTSKVFQDRTGQMSEKEIAAAIKCLAPLKVHPRDFVANRARLVRAERLFKELLGQSRDILDHLLNDFEAALEAQEPGLIDLLGAELDAFMNPYFRGEDQMSS